MISLSTRVSGQPGPAERGLVGLLPRGDLRLGRQFVCCCRGDLPIRGKPLIRFDDRDGHVAAVLLDEGEQPLLRLLHCHAIKSLCDVI